MHIFVKKSNKIARKRKFVFLSEEDKKRFCSANCDLETGNFCIRTRTEDELKAIAELSQAYKAVGEDTATPTQKEIVEWEYLEYMAEKIIS